VFLTHAEDPQPLIAEASWYGEIIHAPRGSHGFGYDPYFFIPEHGCTVAQLEPALKNRISHRGQAMQLLFSKMRERGYCSI
jgi:XTP/dITP diphosphohydrolase